MTGPYFGTDKAAADYCGMSLSAFKRHKQVYSIEKKAGPTRSHYAASDLDAWMENPENFRRVCYQSIDRLTHADIGL